MKVVGFVRILLCIGIILNFQFTVSNPLHAQDDLSAYKFLQLKANHLHYDSASPTMQKFISRWNRVNTAYVLRCQYHGYSYPRCCRRRRYHAPDS